MDKKVMIGTVTILSVVLVSVVVLVYYYSTLPSVPVTEVPPKILYHTSYVQTGISGINFFVVWGLVQNNLQTNIDSVNVTATFYDAENATIGKNVARTALDIIKPGIKSHFEIYFSLGRFESAPFEYELVLSYVKTDKEPIVGVEIVNQTASFDENEYYVIKGEVENKGVFIAEHVRVFGIYYDSEGNIKTVSPVYVTTLMNPEVKASFELTSEPYKNPASYELLAFARNYETYILWSPRPEHFVILIVFFVGVVVYLKRRGW